MWSGQIPLCLTEPLKQIQISKEEALNNWLLRLKASCYQGESFIPPLSLHLTKLSLGLSKKINSFAFRCFQDDTPFPFYRSLGFTRSFHTDNICDFSPASRNHPVMWEGTFKAGNHGCMHTFFSNRKLLSSGRKNKGYLLV